jgi:hypothetical protein
VLLEGGIGSVGLGGDGKLCHDVVNDGDHRGGFDHNNYLVEYFAVDAASQRRTRRVSVGPAGALSAVVTEDKLASGVRLEVTRSSGIILEVSRKQSFYFVAVG